MDTDCYEKLTNAIIIQAVKDFRIAYRRMLRDPESREAAGEVARQSRFFVSDWYATLTDLDGSMLINKIMETEKQKFREKGGRHGEACTQLPERTDGTECAGVLPL